MNENAANILATSYPSIVLATHNRFVSYEPSDNDITDTFQMGGRLMGRLVSTPQSQPILIRTALTNAEAVAAGFKITLQIAAGTSWASEVVRMLQSPHCWEVSSSRLRASLAMWHIWAMHNATLPAWCYGLALGLARSVDQTSPPPLAFWDLVTALVKPRTTRNSLPEKVLRMIQGEGALTNIIGATWQAVHQLPRPLLATWYPAEVLHGIILPLSASIHPQLLSWYIIGHAAILGAYAAVRAGGSVVAVDRGGVAIGRSAGRQRFDVTVQTSYDAIVRVGSAHLEAIARYLYSQYNFPGVEDTVVVVAELLCAAWEVGRDDTAFAAVVGPLAQVVSAVKTESGAQLDAAATGTAVSLALRRKAVTLDVVSKVIQAVDKEATWGLPLVEAIVRSLIDIATQSQQTSAQLTQSIGSVFKWNILRQQGNNLFDAGRLAVGRALRAWGADYDPAVAAATPLMERLQSHIRSSHASFGDVPNELRLVLMNQNVRNRIAKVGGNSLRVFDELSATVQEVVESFDNGRGMTIGRLEEILRAADRANLGRGSRAARNKLGQQVKSEYELYRDFCAPDATEEEFISILTAAQRLVLSLDQEWTDVVEVHRLFSWLGFVESSHVRPEKPSQDDWVQMQVSSVKRDLDQIKKELYKGFDDVVQRALRELGGVELFKKRLKKRLDSRPGFYLAARPPNRAELNDAVKKTLDALSKLLVSDETTIATFAAECLGIETRDTSGVAPSTIGGSVIASRDNPTKSNLKATAEELKALRGQDLAFKPRADTEKIGEADMRQIARSMDAIQRFFGAGADAQDADQLRRYAAAATELLKYRVALPIGLAAATEAGIVSQNSQYELLEHPMYKSLMSDFKIKDSEAKVPKIRDLVHGLTPDELGVLAAFAGETTVVLRYLRKTRDNFDQRYQQAFNAAATNPTVRELLHDLLGVKQTVDAFVRADQPLPFDEVARGLYARLHPPLDGDRVRGGNDEGGAAVRQRRRVLPQMLIAQVRNVVQRWATIETYMNPNQRESARELLQHVGEYLRTGHFRFTTADIRDEDAAEASAAGARPAVGEEPNELDLIGLRFMRDSKAGKHASLSAQGTMDDVMPAQLLMHVRFAHTELNAWEGRDETAGETEERVEDEEDEEESDSVDGDEGYGDANDGGDTRDAAAQRASDEIVATKQMQRVRRQLSRFVQRYALAQDIVARRAELRAKGHAEYACTAKVRPLPANAADLATTRTDASVTISSNQRRKAAVIAPSHVQESMAEGEEEGRGLALAKYTKLAPDVNRRTLEKELRRLDGVLAEWNALVVSMGRTSARLQMLGARGFAQLQNAAARARVADGRCRVVDVGHALLPYLVALYRREPDTLMNALREAEVGSSDDDSGPLERFAATQETARDDGNDAIRIVDASFRYTQEQNHAVPVVLHRLESVFPDDQDYGGDGLWSVEILIAAKYESTAVPMPPPEAAAGIARSVSATRLAQCYRAYLAITATTAGDPNNLGPAPQQVLWAEAAPTPRDVERWAARVLDGSYAAGPCYVVGVDCLSPTAQHELQQALLRRRTAHVVDEVGRRGEPSTPFAKEYDSGDDAGGTSPVRNKNPERGGGVGRSSAASGKVYLIFSAEANTSSYASFRAGDCDSIDIGLPDTGAATAGMHALRCVGEKRPITRISYFTGPSGCGKSRAIALAAKVENAVYLRIPVNEGFSATRMAAGYEAAVVNSNIGNRSVHVHLDVSETAFDPTVLLPLLHTMAALGLIYDPRSGSTTLLLREVSHTIAVELPAVAALDSSVRYGPRSAWPASPESRSSAASAARGDSRRVGEHSREHGVRQGADTHPFVAWLPILTVLRGQCVEVPYLVGREAAFVAAYIRASKDTNLCGNNLPDDVPKTIEDMSVPETYPPDTMSIIESALAETPCPPRSVKEMALAIAHLTRSLPLLARLRDVVKKPLPPECRTKLPLQQNVEKMRNFFGGAIAAAIAEAAAVAAYGGRGRAADGSAALPPGTVWLYNESQPNPSYGLDNSTEPATLADAGFLIVKKDRDDHADDGVMALRQHLPQSPDFVHVFGLLKLDMAPTLRATVAKAFGFEATSAMLVAVNQSGMILTPHLAQQLLMLRARLDSLASLILEGDTGIGKSLVMQTFSHLINASKLVTFDVRELCVAALHAVARTAIRAAGTRSQGAPFERLKDTNTLPFTSSVEDVLKAVGTALDHGNQGEGVALRRANVIAAVVGRVFAAKLRGNKSQHGYPLLKDALPKNTDLLIKRASRMREGDNRARLEELADFAFQVATNPELARHVDMTSLVDDDSISASSDDDDKVNDTDASGDDVEEEDDDSDDDSAKAKVRRRKHRPLIQSRDDLFHMLEDLMELRPRYIYRRLVAQESLTYSRVAQFIDEVVRDAERVREAVGDAAKLVVFVDETNTAGVLGVLTEIFTSHTFDGAPLPRNVFFVGAINPRRSLTERQDIDGSDDDADANAPIGPGTVKPRVQRHVDYTNIASSKRREAVVAAGGDVESAAELTLEFFVRPLPASMEWLTVPHDSLTRDEEEVFLTEFLQTSKSADFLKLITGDDADPGNMALIRQAVAKFIVTAQDAVREYKLKRVHPCMRDLVRTVRVANFLATFQAHSVVDATTGRGQTGSEVHPFLPTSPSRRNKHAVGQALMLAVAMTYMLRLPSQSHAEDYRTALDCAMQSSTYGNESPITSLHHLGLLPPPPSTEEYTLQAMWSDALKALWSHVGTLPADVVEWEPLKESFYTAVVCIATRVALLITGKPGCGKTFTESIVAKVLRGPAAHKPVMRQLFSVLVQPFQCCEQTEASDIVKAYINARKLQAQRDESKTSRFGTSVWAVFDEAGLPKHRRQALKGLHDPLDECKVAFMLLSNTTLDAAKTSRTLQVQMAPADPEAMFILTMGMLGVNQSSATQIVRKRASGLERAFKGLVEFEKRGERLFTQRDYFYLLKGLRHDIAHQRKAPGDFDLKTLCRAVRRNFQPENRRNAGSIMQLFAKECGFDLGGLTKEELSGRSLQALRDALIEQADDSQEGALSPHLRHVLLLTPTGSVTGLDELVKSEVKFVSLSSFRDDNGPLAEAACIGTVLRAMKEGGVVALMNTGPIHSALYALLNRHYEPKEADDGGPKGAWTTVAIGAMSRDVNVHPAARIVVVMNLKELESSQMPFISRLEKHFYCRRDILDDEISTMVSGGLEALPDWLRTYVANLEVFLPPADEVLGKTGGTAGGDDLDEGAEDDDVDEGRS